MSQKILVSFRDNWADEMDIEGHAIYDQDEWNHLVERSKCLRFPYEYYIGTNEFIDFRSHEEMISNFKVQEITEQEAEVIERLLGKWISYMPDLEELVAISEEDAAWGEVTEDNESP